MGAWLKHFWEGIVGDFLDLPDAAQVGQIVGRVLVAAVLGAILGYEREQKGKAAGIRTHMLVTLAAAFFIISAQQAGMSNADVSRVIQGLAAGVGFLGAGTILKQNEQGHVVGLTTAAGLYLATAIGIAAGMGRETTAILGTVLAMIVLALILPAERWIQFRFTDGIRKKSAPGVIDSPSEQAAPDTAQGDRIENPKPA
jgi:putative Mg2+ transporter-C (MgtC) family protein